MGDILKDKEVTQTIIGCAMKVHRALGFGFLESVYHKALLHELGEIGLKVESEKPIPVFYDGVMVGDFFADMLVEDRVIVELKAVEKLAGIHEVQTVNYLVATGLDVGLLLNFGAQRLEFKRKFGTPKAHPENLPGSAEPAGHRLAATPPRPCGVRVADKCLPQRQAPVHPVQDSASRLRLDKINRIKRISHPPLLPILRILFILSNFLRPHPVHPVLIIRY